MVAYLLDTNHASPLVTRGHPLPGRVRERATAGDTFALGVPVLTETLFGIGLLPRAARHRAEWAQLRAILPCYIPAEADGAAAATLHLALRRPGRHLATVDAPIAVIALRHALVRRATAGGFSVVPGLAQEHELRAG